jgi:type II secretory pathway pseudopilin PulG
MKNRPGTSIIEIIIATALIGMAIIAALSLTNHSQKQNTYARELAEASGYATQAADWIKTEKETLGWETINTQAAGDYCLSTIPADFSALSW